MLAFHIVYAIAKETCTWLLYMETETHKGHLLNN
jgi:hypothetical protein